MNSWLLILALAVPSWAYTKEQPIKVVSLHTVLTEIAREVGGDQASVTGLVKPGIDPHAFDPSAADIGMMAEADLVLAAGLNLEGYLDRLVANTGGRARVVQVGQSLPDLITGAHNSPAHPSHAGNGDEFDPHWWHSITLVIHATDLVRAEYTRLRPASAAIFAANANAYSQRLTALQVWAQAQVASLNQHQRQLVTSHDAFGYLARDFGFTVHPIGGLSAESEPDAKQLVALVNLIRREKIHALFTEASANPRVLENLVRETGVRLGGELYADGLGAAGSDAETYEAMVRHNLGTIIQALR